MAQRNEFKDSIPFAAEKVMDKMLDMDFIREWSIVQGASSADPKLVEKSDTIAITEVSSEEPIPTVGNIKAHYKFTWNLTQKKCTWVRTATGLGAKSEVSGSTEIVADGDDSCFFVDMIDVKVKVPVIGKKIEKMVAKHLSDGHQAKIDFLLKNL